MECLYLRKASELVQLARLAWIYEFRVWNALGILNIEVVEDGERIAIGQFTGEAATLAADIFNVLT